MNETGDGTCIGRFQFTKPEPLAITRRSQVIYRVTVGTIPLPPGGAASAWGQALENIRTRSLPAGGTVAIVRSFELQPGTPAVWFIGDPDSETQRDLEAMKPVGGHAVQADAQADSGMESAAEGLVKTILNSYVPNAGHGFCVGLGSITLDPAQIEKTSMELTHRQVVGLKIQFHTETVKEPDTETYSNLQEERLFVAASGGKLTVLRDQQRTVAGLEGKEIGIAIATPREPPSLRFTWHFPGARLDGTRPQIDVVGTAPVDREAELERNWETILQSLRTVPVSTH